MDTRLQRLMPGTVLRTLADLPFPRVCITCGRQLLPCERVLCCCCEADLPRTHYELSTHNPMADRFNSQINGCRYCYATALFYYTGPYKQITRALKYDRNFSAGRRFARELGYSIPDWMMDVDAVVPVPLHWTRRWRRGYNQAEVIARSLASTLKKIQASRKMSGDISCNAADARYVHLLRRARRTRSQALLGMSEKSGNVKGAFRVRKSKESGCIRHILLIDDVFTTGATLAACHTAILEGLGDEVRVSVATLSFVGRA